MGDALRVEVVFALPDRAVVRVVEVREGTGARAAVLASGIAAELPGVDVGIAPLGCFGRRIDDDEAVADGDRLEIYRPLRVDPKQARRERRRR